MVMGEEVGEDVMRLALQKNNYDAEQTILMLFEPGKQEDLMLELSQSTPDVIPMLEQEDEAMEEEDEKE